MEQEIGASRLDELIQQWIGAKYLRTKSDRTHKAYAETLNRFRVMLQREGLDVLSPVDDVEPVALRFLLHVKQPGKVQISGSTFNTRHAILSSFYAYLIKRGWKGVNPLDRIDRSHEQGRSKGKGIDEQQLVRRLNAVDRRTRTGRRDFALIEFAAMTGKRDHEIRALNVGDLFPQTDGVLIQWPKLKGGKKRDQLYQYPHATSLLRYLVEQYGESWRYEPPETPVWCSLSGNSHGRITRSGIVYIFKQRLGITAIHTTRYLFARMLHKAGAPPRYIQAMLDHAKLDTTQGYLDDEDTTINRFGQQMTKQLIETSHEGDY